MPDLTGMTREEAEKLIAAQNLTIRTEGILQQYSDVVEKGRVISQSIDAEERIAVQTEVSMTVSLGDLSQETALLTVPDLAGLTKANAVKQLKQLKEEQGFTYSLGEVRSKYNSKVKKGRIISQSLKAGSQARTNEVIHIVISKGPKLIQVPDMVYMAQDVAVKKLKETGFGVNIQTEYNSQVSEGLVISQDAEAGSKAEKGTVVTIVVSLGKEAVQTDHSSGQPGSSVDGSPGNNSSQSQSGGGTGSGQPRTGSSTDNVQPQTGSGNRQPQTDSGNGSSQSESGSSDGSGTGGEKAIMPDGGSFVVE